MVWFLVLFLLDTLVDFLAMNRDFLGRIDADADLVALDSQYRHGDFITHHQGLTNPTSQNKHSILLKL
ncbi:hypothetical protein NS337_15230 [Pseudomonas oryzihabitans]|nr:hypothetical protein NS337_15230 [Pseudomonas psychrotolerans]